MFILWALTFMRLVSDCLNILSSLVEGITPDSIMSLRTLPGPTDGSWSTSPTRTRLVPGSIALSMEFIRRISTIDTSSTIIALYSRGDSSFLLKNSELVSSLKVYSKSLWIVLASLPEVSVILLAALPVGAQRAGSLPISSKTLIRVFMTVVFPVPGPPVIIDTPFSRALTIPSFCFSVSFLTFSFSILFIILSISFSFSGW